MLLDMEWSKVCYVLLYLCKYGCSQSLPHDGVQPSMMSKSENDLRQSKWDVPGYENQFPNHNRPLNAHEVFSCACKDEAYSDTPSRCHESEICNTTIACFTHFTDGDSEKSTKGCISSREKYHFICKVETANMECCEEEMCNLNLVPTSPPDSAENKIRISTTLIIIIISLILGFLCLCFTVLFFVRRVHKRRMQELEKQREAGKLEGGLRAINVGDSTLADWMNSATSGSGSGLPLLAQRTLARQITLVNCIGKGRYGEVWKGTYQEEPVAVKIFASRDEQSWARETEIYNTVLLRHSSVLGYIASDMTSRNSETQLWLVCYYHALGSLYEFLQHRELDKELMLQLCLTAANGIAHLHTDISGVCGKAAIAHRDIKSKNILVKDDLTCCIADLGLAVTHNPTEGKLTIPKNDNRVGTKRYMSPEVLEETLNTHSFACFKHADIYSFALVLWEVARRCRCGGVVEEYNPPYYDVVNYDPSFEEMRKVVCVDEYRPEIPNTWTTDSTLSMMAKMMQEMWYKNPSARLPILRVKKTIKKAADQLAPDKLATTNLDDDKDPLIAMPPKISDSSYDTNP